MDTIDSLRNEMNHDLKILSLTELEVTYYKSLQCTKKQWPPGPWHDEPDNAMFENQPFIGEIRRHALGHLCGYVHIPTYLKKYFVDKDEYNTICSFDVHGGINYNQKCSGHKKCFVIGFDCAHLGDLIPQSQMMNSVYDDYALKHPEWEKSVENIKKNRSKDTYKTFEFVTNQINNLIDQIRELIPRRPSFEVIPQRPSFEVISDKGHSWTP